MEFLLKKKHETPGVAPLTPPPHTSTHHDVSLEQERWLDGHTQTPAAGALEVTAEITAVMECYHTRVQTRYEKVAEGGSRDTHYMPEV